MSDVLVTYFSASGVTRNVAEKIAETRGLTTDEILKITTQNAKKLYGIE